MTTENLLGNYLIPNKNKTMLTKNQIVEILKKQISKYFPMREYLHPFITSMDEAADKILALQEQPVSTSPYEGITIPFAELKASEGISLLDRFALQAMEIASKALEEHYVRSSYSYDMLAQKAYIIAKCMMQERDKNHSK